MTNKDSLQRFIFEDANIRGEMVNLTTTFQTIMTQHSYPSAIRKILAEVLTSACLLSGMIKTEGRLTVQFQGEKPLKLLLAQCTHKYELRGLAQWEGDLSDEDILAALKNGTLGIIINADAHTTSYEGIVKWQGNSFAESMEIYFRDSEQLATRIWLAVNETSSAGLLLQLMPDANKKIWDDIISSTQHITPKELLSLDTTSLLKQLYEQHDIRIFHPTPINFGCTCSTERSENAIRMLGEEEAMEEVKTKQNLVVTCEFCNSEYVFSRKDVENIFKHHSSH